MIDPIETVVVLNTTQDAAFDAFVGQINAWWPVSKFSVCAGKITIDPRLGGLITETDTDGTVHEWGRVTAWQTGKHIAISWYVGDAAIPTNIAVTFAPTDDGRTGVTLVHNGWDALGKAALEKRGNYVRGWAAIFEVGYADFANKHYPALET